MNYPLTISRPAVLFPAIMHYEHFVSNKPAVGVSLQLDSQQTQNILGRQTPRFPDPEKFSIQVLRLILHQDPDYPIELSRQDIDQIWAMEPVSIVTVVGAGMRHTPGIAGALFTALGNASVNVIAIAQGSSECSISVVVADHDTGTAVSQIHRLIGMNDAL